MVTVPGHSSYFFSIFCQTRLDFGSSAIVGNHSIAYKMPILGLKSIAKEYQTARSRKLLRVRCQKVFHKKHFKMFSIPVGLSCDQARLPRKGHEAVVVGWEVCGQQAVSAHFLSFSSNSPPTTSSMKPPPKPPCLLRPGSRQLTINFPTDLGVVVAGLCRQTYANNIATVHFIRCQGQQQRYSYQQKKVNAMNDLERFFLWTMECMCYCMTIQKPVKV